MRVVERLAERYGFQLRGLTWVGHVDGFEVQLTGIDDQVQIVFQLPQNDLKGLALVIDHLRPVPPWPFPAEDLVITGDPRFDAEAHVVGPAVAALARLDLPARESLRAWPGLSLHKGRLVVGVSTQRVADQFMGTLRALRHTVRHLCIPAAVIQSRLEARLQSGREPASHQQAVLQALARAGWLHEELLRALLDHPRAALRLEAATLAPPDDPGAARTLWSLILDRSVSPGWRTEAVHRWMARAPQDCRRGGLTDLMDCPHPEVLAATCFWWGQEPDAREKLGAWLKHPATDVRAAAMVSLSSLTTVLRPQEEALIIRALYTYTETNITQAALQALRVGGTRSLKAVRDYLESNRASPEVRRAARATLKALQTRRRALPGRLAIVDNENEGRLSLPGGQAA